MREELYVSPINPYIQKRASLAIVKRKEEVLDEEILDQFITSTVEGLKNDEDVLSALRRIDLTRVIKESKEVDQVFPCPFFMDREAWIHRNTKGEYRYYTKVKSSVFYFDVIDLLQIFRNESRKKTLAYIENRWGLTNMTPWFRTQQEKWERNQRFLEELQQFPKRYPSLHQIIGKHFPVLETVNRYAREKVVKEEWSINGNAIFFLSTHYLKEEYFPQRSTSTLNSLMNLFCVLGFLEKVPYENIPETLADNTWTQYKKSQLNNYVSFYAMKDISLVSDEAEKRAAILLENGIYYHKLTKKVVFDIFGENFARTIYVQKTYGKKKKVEPVYVRGESDYYTEQERLEEHFVERLATEGKCEKHVLKQLSLLPHQRFHGVWKDLVHKYRCKEWIPSKKECQIYQLQKRVLIATPMFPNSEMGSPQMYEGG